MKHKKTKKESILRKDVPMNIFRLCLGLLLLVLPLTTWGQKRAQQYQKADFMVDSICYAINPDGHTLTVVPYVDSLTDSSKYTSPIIIPPHVERGYDYYKVTNIADFAFKGIQPKHQADGDMYDHLVSITLPATLKTIGDGAFDKCRMIFLSIPEGVTKIGKGYFECETLSIPSTLTDIDINDLLSGHRNIIVADGNPRFKVSNDLLLSCKGDTVLAKANSTDQITVPATVKYIDDKYGVISNVSRMTLLCSTPPQIINYKSFNNYLTIYVPDSALQAYKSDASWGQFKGLTARSTVMHKVGDEFTANGLKFRVNNDSTLTLLRNKRYLDDPYSDTFYGVLDFTQPIVDDANNSYRITAIEDSAMMDKQDLKQIVFPAVMPKIGKDAFKGCYKISDIRMNAITPPDSITSLGKIKWLTVPKGAKEAYAAADGWKNHAENIREVAKDSLADDEWFGDGNFAYRYYRGNLGLYFYGKCERLVVPEHVTYKGIKYDVVAALASNNPRKKYSVGELFMSDKMGFGPNMIVPNYGYYVNSSEGELISYRGCLYRGQHYRPEVLIGIPQYIRNLVMAPTTRDINEDLFQHRDYGQHFNFESISISPLCDFRKVLSRYGINSDRPLDNLHEYIVQAGNPWLKAVDGVLFSASGDTLLAYPRWKNTANNEYTIPEGVTIIGHGAFPNAYYLNTLNLPSSLRIVGDRAFGAPIKSISLPEGVTTIGSGAFCNNNIKAISIPSTVTTYNDLPFVNINREGIEVYSLRTDPVPLADIKNYTIPGTLWVPQGCKDAYAAADGWKSFGTIKELTNKADNEQSQVVALVVGMLEKLIDYVKAHPQETLKIIGHLNGDDLETLRNLLNGSNTNGAKVANVRRTTNNKAKRAESGKVITDLDLADSQLEVGGVVTTENVMPNGILSNASQLKKLVLPTSLAALDDGALAHCTGLDTLKILATTPPTATSAVFTDIDKQHCVLWVPREAKEAYASADGWKDFLHIATGIKPTLQNDEKLDHKAPIYDLQGQQINTPVKGQVFISKGKKYIGK